MRFDQQGTGTLVPVVFIFNLDKVLLKKLFPTMNI